MSSRRPSVIALALFVVASSPARLLGFKFMSGWKIPSYQDAIQEAKVQERFGDKKLVVLTGTSSGLGRKAALALLRTGDYHVIGAVRDIDKMEAVAEVDGFDMDNFTPMKCELNSFDSVKDFCQRVEDFRLGKPIDRLICNAGVYQPTLPYPKWSMDNHEQTMQINYLSHFLMISELMPKMYDATDPRVTMVGSVTGNDNTVGGGGVYPIADLHELDGFKAGFENPISMADGYSFDGAKAYKDSKLCLMMLANTLHARYHKLTGVSFSSIYPGCIAESPLFREKRAWFRKYFPVFMKFITGGFVGEEEAGQRLFQVAHDPRCRKSGVYWSWNGGPREGRGAEALEKGGQISGGGGAGGGWDSIYENDQSAKVLDIDLTMDLFKYSTEITGAEWPDLKAVTSPCPTLKVIGAVSKYMIAKEEMKRVRGERPGFNEDGTPIRISKIKKTAMVADRVASKVVGNTVGRVARFFGRRLLGKIPETAKRGSFHVDEDTTVASESDVSTEAAVDELVEAIVAETEEPGILVEVDSDEKQSPIETTLEDAEELLQQEIADTVFSSDEESESANQEEKQAAPIEETQPFA